MHNIAFSDTLTLSQEAEMADSEDVDYDSPMPQPCPHTTRQRVELEGGGWLCAVLRGDASRMSLYGEACVKCGALNLTLSNPALLQHLLGAGAGNERRGTQ